MSHQKIAVINIMKSEGDWSNLQGQPLWKAVTSKDEKDIKELSRAMTISAPILLTTKTVALYV